MAAFESLRSLFEKSLTDSPTLMESLSWNQMKPVQSPDDDAAVTEIFGELHFEERRHPSDAGPSLQASLSSAAAAAGSDTSPPPTSPWLPALDRGPPALDAGKDESLRRNGGDPSRCSSPGSFWSHRGGDDAAQFQRGHGGSFQLCTEGLGFESSDVDVEDSMSESGGAVDATPPRPLAPAAGYTGFCPKAIWGRRPRSTVVEFPPPITCMGSLGKPCFRFSSHREGGRFVLREVRLPRTVLLHASRTDGRLRLQFVQPDQEIEEEEQEQEQEQEQEGGSSEEGDGAEGDAEI